jgi:hypothetical protein
MAVNPIIQDNGGFRRKDLSHIYITMEEQ